MKSICVALFCACLSLTTANQGRSVAGEAEAAATRLEVIPAQPAADVSLNSVLVEPEAVAGEPGFIDSVLGEGTQSRIVDSVSSWVSNKAKSNPGCVERFVCETYRAGETMDGIPYFIMSITNAAVSFMVAEMFDESIDIKEITRAARYGRTVGSCHQLDCDFLDGQIRSVGEILGSFEEFLYSVVDTISNSIG